MILTRPQVMGLMSLVMNFSTDAELEIDPPNNYGEIKVTLLKNQRVGERDPRAGTSWLIAPRGGYRPVEISADAPETADAPA